MIIVVDFDGTIVEDMYPCIGSERKNAFKVLKQLKADGHIMVLNTCREGYQLHAAVMFLGKENIIFDYVNMHPIPEMIKHKNDPRKVTGDIVIDDKILRGLPDDWDEIYEIIQEKINES